MVGRGTQKNRNSLQTASAGRGLQNTQRPSQVAPSGRSLPKAQSISQTAPSGRVPPKSQLPLQAASNRRGLLKTQPTSQRVPNDRGPQNPQLPTRPAPTAPSFLDLQPIFSAACNSHGAPNTQPALRITPNGRVPPNIPPHPKSAPKEKEDIPYEIKNAREWDPNRGLEGNSSSESSDDDESYDSDCGEHPQVFGGVFSTLADDGSQTVVEKSPQFNTRLHDQPSDHPKVYPHHKHLGHRRAQPRVNFNYKRDNLARAAFRKRLDPTGRFMLPKDCPDIEPNQKRMYDTFDEIGVRLGSFVRPPQHVEDRELLLWGDAHQIQATKVELQRWLDNRLLPRTFKAKDTFARELSIIGDHHHRLMKKMKKEAKILDSQQVPAEGRVFSHTGTFLWPVEEVRPEDILGSSLEAFDPIRIQYHCHIVFDTKFSSFRIFSDKAEHVEKTKDRLVGTMKEYVAKSARPDVVILVEPPNSSAMREDVKILPTSLNDPKANKSLIPVLTGRTLNPEARNEWLDESKSLTMKNNRRMELSLRKCIARLPHYRGLVRMRVHFGTFALKFFRWREGADSTPFGEFMNNMTMSGTKAIMIRE